jgi:hypothetical protein
MDDGTEFECRAGDVCLIPPGHDAWVVGNEPVEAVDFQGMRSTPSPSGRVPGKVSGAMRRLWGRVFSAAFPGVLGFVSFVVFRARFGIIPGMKRNA